MMEMDFQNETMLLADNRAADASLAGRPSPDDDLYHGTSEAVLEGARVVEGLQSGVLLTIAACVRTQVAMSRFKGNASAIDDFLRPFVKAKLLTASEARLGESSSKLSKLCKIGEYASRLKHPDLLQYFLESGCSGYTVMYQTAVLLDQFQSDDGDDVCIPLLVDTLRRDQVNTRHGMLRLTKKLKAAKRDVDPDASVSAVISQSGQGSAESIQKSDDFHRIGQFDIVLAEPRRSDIFKLREYYVGPPPRCLRTGEVISNEAAIIVIAALSDFPVVRDKLLPFCGFEGVSPHVFLTQRPAEPDVTEAKVAIVAKLGADDCDQVCEVRWNLDGRPIDPIALASQLAPNAKNKLRLFASSDADGWHNVVDEANWSQVDE